MKINTFLSGVVILTLLVSCSPKEKSQETSSLPADSTKVQTPEDTVYSKKTISDAHNSANSLDWSGTYEAIVPCADCPGIKTSITLKKDKTFSITEEYLERNSKNEDKGTFEWDAAGNVITLKGKTTDYKYQVGENKITQLDLSGQPIDGPNKNLYVYKKK